eukprot:scaffold43699_cov80-Phaeocystis_antarctica.AAC.3
MASGARRWPRSSYLSMRPGRMSAARVELFRLVGRHYLRRWEGVGLGRCEVQGKGAWRGHGVGASGRWSWAYQNAIRRVDNAVGASPAVDSGMWRAHICVSTFVHAGGTKSS